jgi:hypothetical protein
MIGTIIRFLLRPERITAIFKLLRRRGQGNGGFIPAPEPICGRAWTREIKPQDSAVLRFSLQGLPEGRKLGRAFASTLVGDTFKASRHEMREFAQKRKTVTVG